MADNKSKDTQKDEKGEDFKYIVRLVNTDIDGEKQAITALTSIKGVGSRIAGIAIKEIGFPPNKQIGHISDEDAAKLVEILNELSDNLPEWMLNRQKDWESGDDLHLLSTELSMTHNDDINRLRMIRCYRGIRHESGQKVRGQRTRSNGRSGLTLGVSKRREQ